MRERDRRAIWWLLGTYGAVCLTLELLGMFNSYLDRQANRFWLPIDEGDESFYAPDMRGKTERETRDGF